MMVENVPEETSAANSARRLIEAAFPIAEASIDSVHEKNVRQGHISTLHIWPARRPLAACRAALVATLLPDPGSSEQRRALLRRLAGQKVNGKTEGGILHWGNESSPDVKWFREEIRKAYGGRAPRVLDPFAGGGAIPLEAMRLGCEATAADINPVAWFILKCTLEYPQRFAGKTWPLPEFARETIELRNQLNAKMSTVRKRGGTAQESMLDDDERPEADLAGHVRAWGWWVLQRAKAELERFYPAIAGKQTIAYLWARTVTCKGCRAALPLLKTRWLCKKDDKRVSLTIQVKPDKSGVTFGVQSSAAQPKGTAAQKKAQDKAAGGGTMSRAGATCPVCGVIMTMEDLRREGQAGRIGTVMTAVVVEGERGKEYRLPVAAEIEAAEAAKGELNNVFAEIPFGLPDEPLPSSDALGFRIPLYGFRQWSALFTPRQLLSIGSYIVAIRAAATELGHFGYEVGQVEAIVSLLTCLVSKLADKNSTLVEWQPHRLCIGHTFKRWALPMTWDFVEVNVLSSSTGNASDTINWICSILDNNHHEPSWSLPSVFIRDAQSDAWGTVDVVVTDPPYYDAIPYSDVMDFFYVWLRRTLHGLTVEMDQAFSAPLAPKWNGEQSRGELIDDASRFDGNAAASRRTYEEGMASVFQLLRSSLTDQGRLVIVFAHKKPSAWETLTAAIVRSGFVVDASWPIETEMAQRMRALSSAALSSSIWLVCTKRPADARPGWDHEVLDEMRANITSRLREFWDAGIRGPDFVWAATGPALEAYSKHPVVKKADEPGQVMTVSEFLAHARRIVVDFVVGRVLSRGEDGAPTGSLDEVTTYYLLHRNDFKMEPAPAGACILYAISCNLRDSDLTTRYDLLARAGGSSEETNTEENSDAASDDADAEPAAEAVGSSSQLRLKTWSQRRAAREDGAADRLAPLIDRIHRLMFLWNAGDAGKVDEFLSAHGLWQNPIFHQVLQSLIEMAPPGDRERTLLESISNHVSGRSDQPEQAVHPTLFSQRGMIP